MIGTFIGHGKFAELDDLPSFNDRYQKLRIKRDGEVVIELSRDEVERLVEFLKGRMVPE